MAQLQTLIILYDNSNTSDQDTKKFLPYPLPYTLSYPGNENALVLLEALLLDLCPGKGKG